MDKLNELIIMDIVNRFEFLLREKRKYEDDILATEKALKDPKCDFLSIREFKNDLIYDKGRLDEIESELKKIRFLIQEKVLVMDIVNEDGTDRGLFPKNPLLEKWAWLYPSIPNPELNQMCDSYSCMWCSRCPKGRNWVVPSEDMNVWNKYQEEVLNYNKIHNPSLVNESDNVKIKVLNTLISSNNS